MDAMYPQGENTIRLPPVAAREENTLQNQETHQNHRSVSDDLQTRLFLRGHEQHIPEGQQQFVETGFAKVLVEARERAADHLPDGPYEAEVTGAGFQGYAQRILEERAEVIPPAKLPSTWEEAKAEVPGLMKWTTARKAALTSGAKISVFDYLRDFEHGLGKWATSENGLPRNVLRRIDATCLLEVQAYKNKVPEDIHLPNASAGRPSINPPEVTLTIEDATNAIRKARSAYRQAVSKKQI